MLNKIQISFKNNSDLSSEDVFARYRNIRQIPSVNQQNNVLYQQHNDEFVNNKKNQVSSSHLKRNTALIGGVIAFGAAAFGIVKAIKSRNILASVDKAVALTAEQIKTFEHQMKDFPQDIDYRKSILKCLGLNSEEYHKLRPIIGAEELVSLVKDLEKNKMNYTPGKMEYGQGEKILFKDLSNVENHSYRANLHLHTRYSDGNLTVPEVLEQAVEYADRVAEKNPSKSPFVLAITDHDTVNGCKEAVEIIGKNPWKYRNLRLVLGIEHTTIHKNENLLHQPAQVHLLAYNINPFEKDFQDFLNFKLQKHQKNIINVLQNANNKFKNILEKNNFNYSFDEAKRVAPCFESSSQHNIGYMKDYLQFRLIYAHTVENNSPLKEFMKQNGVEVQSLDFVKGRDYIPAGKLDYTNGQTYWGYYYEGLKKYITQAIKEKNPKVNEKQLTEKFLDISSEVKNTLGIIEAECPNLHSDLYVKAEEPYGFSETVSKTASLDHGVMGMAHPGVFFPTNCMKNKSDIPKLMEELYGIFVEKGKDKAKFSEDYYQIRFQSMEKILDEIDKISSKHGFLKTGSLDTHGKSIFKEY